MDTDTLGSRVAIRGLAVRRAMAAVIVAAAATLAACADGPGSRAKPADGFVVIQPQGSSANLEQCARDAAKINNGGAFICQSGSMPGEGVVAIPAQSVVGRHEAEAALLARLSVAGAQLQPGTIEDPRRLAAGFGGQLGSVQTYGSWSVLRDSGTPQLAAHDSIRIAFAADVREPDTAHVAQTAWDGSDYVYDDWIAIKDSEFAGLIGWIKSGPLGRSALRDRLGLRKYVQLLVQEQPKRVESYAYDGSRYVRFGYEVPLAGDFVELFRGSQGPVLQGPLQIELWVNSASGLLVKAHVSGAATIPGASPWELEQVFVGYGDHVRIDTPAR